MTTETYEDLGIRICADWSQASSQIKWQPSDRDEDEDAWHATPFQVAGHSRQSAIEAVSDWLDSQ